MKSGLPKVLHRLGGRALLAHVIDSAAGLQPRRLIVVTGHGAEQVDAAARRFAQGAGLAHSPLVLRGLNEYDSAAVIASVHPQPLPKPETPQAYRHYFRVLRQGLTQWAHGALAPVGMPTYAEFTHGVREALDHVRRQHSGNVLMISSGGPIGNAVAQVLGAPPEAAIELNMRIRNTAITVFSFNPKRHSLLSFNSITHLDDPQYADWVTYA
jgi:broad specificity phosphatase PhoE